MRYIGPFFRMNSLSQEEISGQLFYLSKEAIKTIVLNSKCGLIAQVKTSKKSSINDISILNNFSPLLCLYRKASPVFIHNKTSHGFDEASFKKEILPSTNALMTMSLLKLSEYYSHFSKAHRNVPSFESSYRYLAKEQLHFYSENLRNTEGLFVSKKNQSDGNSKGYNLVDKDNKFRFSDQAFMMDAYLLYSIYNKDDDTYEDYKNFSYEILNLFKDYKDSLYELSFSESVQVFFALNIFYKYSDSIVAKELILDLGDYLVNKFQEKDYYIDSLDDCALFSICLMQAYKHTDIISFKDVSKAINDKLISLYDSDKNIFLKMPDKKTVKYSCLEINFYLLSLLMYSNEYEKSNELKPIISSIFKRFYVNGGLLTSWPNAPTLDEVERYRKLSLHSNDMLDETYFRMPIIPTPKSSGIAPIFVKNLDYSTKKDSLSKSRTTFDSNKNMLNFFIIIELLKDTVEKIMDFDKLNNSSIDVNNINEDFPNSIDDAPTIENSETKKSSYANDLSENMESQAIKEDNTNLNTLPKALELEAEDNEVNKNKPSTNLDSKNKKIKKNKSNNPNDKKS